MDTVLIKDFPPGAALGEYVRKYQVFRLLFQKDKPLPVKYHTPHPEHCITFYLKDVQKYSNLDSQAIITYPRCVVNGMYNIPLNRYGGYDFLAIKVVLQPGILFCLTGMPVQELANTFIDAEALWGKEVRLVLQQLADVQELKQMLTILDNFFEYLFKHRLCKTLHPVDKAGRFIIYQQRASTLEWLADQSCLSKRQFIRKFEQRQGISPKLFDRIVRFDRAYRMKNKFPEADWLYIALSCGYYDYQHLVKDYKEFTNFTPQSLFELERNTPERKFSIHEC